MSVGTIRSKDADDLARQARCKLAYEGALRVAGSSGSLNKSILAENQLILRGFPWYSSEFESTLNASFTPYQSSINPSGNKSPFQPVIDKLSLEEKLWIIDVNVNGLNVRFIEANDIGLPALVFSEDYSWDSLLNKLSKDTLHYQMQLAMSSYNFETSQDDFDNDIKRLAGNLNDNATMEVGHIVTITQRSYNWEIGVKFAKYLKEIHLNTNFQQLPPTDPEIDVILNEVLAKTPPRLPYYLVAAHVQPGTQMVSPQRLPLFQKAVEEKYEIQSYSDQPLSLTVVAERESGQLFATMPIVSQAELRLAPGQSTILTVKRNGNKAVAFSVNSASQPVIPVKLQTMNDIMDELPETVYSQQHDILDLMVILDQVADDAVLNKRKSFIKDVVTKLQAKLGHRAQLRVGLIAYSDYPHTSRQVEKEETSAISAYPLDEPGETLSELEKLVPFPGYESDFEAALEHALGHLARNTNWTRGSRRYSLLVGSRPAHVPLYDKLDPAQIACTSRVLPPLHKERQLSYFDWRATFLQEIRQKVQLLTVVCPIYWEGPPSLRPGIIPRRTAELPKYARRYYELCWEQWIAPDRSLRFNFATPNLSDLLAEHFAREFTSHKTLRLPVLRRFV